MVDDELVRRLALYCTKEAITDFAVFVERYSHLYDQIRNYNSTEVRKILDSASVAAEIEGKRREDEWTRNADKLFSEGPH